MNDTQSDTQYSISDAKNDTHENEVGGQEIPKVDRKGGQKIKMIPRMTPKMTPKN